MKTAWLLCFWFLSAWSLASAVPTLWLVGDSTVRNRNGALRGWGDELAPYFDAERIQVVNRAIGGRSSHTFYQEGRWESLLQELRPGDFVLIQFGHNDVGPVGEKSRYRGSIKGTGDETREVTKPDGATETVHSYGWYLRHYIATAKAKGAEVVIASPIPHKKWENGRFVRDFQDYGAWAKSSAEAAGAGFIDLTEIIARVYQQAGEETVAAYYGDERTHTTAAGAKSNARSVIAGLKGLPGNPFGELLSAEGRAIPAFQP